MPPRQWPVPGSTQRPFADGRFATPDGRARLIATAARAPRHAPVAEFPLILNTGRIRDQWHTMTRTALAPALNAHEPEPFVDAHPQDLRTAGLAGGDLVRVTSRWGSALARVRASGQVPAGMLFMPIHWNEQFAAEGRVDAVVNPVVDAISGEPEFKHTPVRIEKLEVAWHGFLLSRRRVAAPSSLWWALSPGEGLHRLEFAGRDTAMPDAQWLRQALPGLADADWIEFTDAGTGAYRVALLHDGRLEACLMLARRGTLPARGWLASLFALPKLDPLDRSALLRGARADVPDPGPTVCACFGVGANVIRDAVAGGCGSVQAVGQKTRAGTNCGSCRPEIARIIASGAQPAPGAQRAAISAARS
jgi:assimilatory nitrate reductase catalytic subunit